MNSLIFKLVVFLLFTFSQGQIPTDKLVLSLNFNSNFKDQSPFNHSVINYGGQLSDGVNSKQGLYFSDGKNYLEIPYNSNLLIKNQLTISLWYKHKKQVISTDGYASLFGNYYSLVEQSANEDGGHSRYGLWLVDNQSLSTCVEPDFCVGGGLCQRCTSKRFNFQENQWYHIASTYNNNSLKIYVNGNLISEQLFDSSTGISTRNYPLFIGTDLYDYSPTYLKGGLDEINIFSTVLNQNEIETLYQQTYSLDVEKVDLSKSEKEIYFYPNPAKEYIKTNSDEPINSINIYSSNGILIDKIQNNKNQFDLKGLTSGVYFIKYYYKEQPKIQKIQIIN